MPGEEPEGSANKNISLFVSFRIHFRDMLLSEHSFITLTLFSLDVLYCKGNGFRGLKYFTKAGKILM